MQQMYSCPRCHTQVSYGMRFCGSCGISLNTPPPQQIQYPLSNNQSYDYRQYQPNTQASTQEVVDGLVKYVAARVVEGGSKKQIKDELISEGISEDIASEIIKIVFGYKSNVVRKKGGIQLGIGLLMAIGGVVLTFIGYACNAPH